MQFAPMPQKLKSEQRRLLSIFDKLDPSAREMLLAFAEFLRERQSDPVALDDTATPQPRSIERPAKESVVKAIRRLSETYYMLEREHLLDQTSSLMMSHVLHGRDADTVIDELEAVFCEHYERYRQRRETE